MGPLCLHNLWVTSYNTSTYLFPNLPQIRLWENSKQHYTWQVIPVSTKFQLQQVNTAQNNFNIVSFTFLICLLATVSLKVSASKADGSVIQPWVWNSKNSDCHIVGTCYRLNVSPQNSYVDISSIILIRDEASGRWLSQESRALMKGINALKKKPLRACPFFLPCEDTVILWLSMNQEVGSNQTPNLLAPWSWTVRLESCKEEIFVIWVTQPMVF